MISKNTAKVTQINQKMLSNSYLKTKYFVSHLKLELIRKKGLEKVTIDELVNELVERGNFCILLSSKKLRILDNILWYVCSFLSNLMIFMFAFPKR